MNGNLNVFIPIIPQCGIPCLCTLSTRAFIEPSLHQLDRNLFMETLYESCEHKVLKTHQNQHVTMYLCMNIYYSESRSSSSYHKGKRFREASQLHSITCLFPQDIMGHPTDEGYILHIHVHMNIFSTFTHV